MLRRRGGDRRDGRTAVEATRVTRRVQPPAPRGQARAGTRPHTRAESPAHARGTRGDARGGRGSGRVRARRGAAAARGPGAPPREEDARRPERGGAFAQIFNRFFSRPRGCTRSVHVHGRRHAGRRWAWNQPWGRDRAEGAGEELGVRRQGSQRRDGRRSDWRPRRRSRRGRGLDGRGRPASVEGPGAGVQVHVAGHEPQVQEQGT